MTQRCGATTFSLAASVALALTVGQAGAAITPYFQDFEGLDANSPTALGDDGWLVGANVFNPAGDTFLYNYFSFPAGNGAGGFSNVTSTASNPPGSPPVGNQGLVVFSDYNNADHNIGNQINALVFQERTVTSDDVGKRVKFSFVAADGDLEAPTTAAAFLATIDPSNNFADTNRIRIDTTTLPAGNTTFDITLDIDAGLVGNLFQFGFESTAANFAASGVNYDNISLSVVPEPTAAALLVLGSVGLLRRHRW